VEVEVLLVPVHRREHLVVGLVADAVVEVLEEGGRKGRGKGVGLGHGHVVGQEETLVLLTLDKGVVGVTILIKKKNSY